MLITALYLSITYILNTHKYNKALSNFNIDTDKCRAIEKQAEDYIQEHHLGFQSGIFSNGQEVITAIPEANIPQCTFPYQPMKPNFLEPSYKP
jgi:hypothetical protein